MKLKLLILVLLQGFVVLSIAQIPNLKYIGIDAGMHFFSNEVKNLDYIRGDVPSYNYGYSSKNLTSNYYRSFVGVRYEIFLSNDRISLGTGLRFSYHQGSVGKPNYWTNNSDYFYWLYKQDGVYTNYLRVKEIEQKSSYLTLPIEVRFLASRRPRFVQIYGKVGAELCFLLDSETKITFFDKKMDIYGNDLKMKVDNPESFFAALYPALGLRFGKELSPLISIEVNPVYIPLAYKAFGLLNASVGGGFSIQIQLPIKPYEL